MENIIFYPKITPDLIENSGLSVDKYEFSYLYQGSRYVLKTSGKSTIKLIDPLEYIWNVEDEGLIIRRNVKIAYPELLHGSSGIACRGAEIGICIIWTNKKIPQTGVILPSSDVSTAQGRVCSFDHTFEKGIITGDLDLSLILYIKKKAEVVLEDEKNLMNDEGVSIGELESISLDFKNMYMDFPIEEYNSPDQPLWWVDFNEWEDPISVDLFTKENICLYLNPYYEACPAPAINGEGNRIKNFDLLVDIMSQTYLLMFRRLSEDQISSVIGDTNMPYNTIGYVLHDFVERCNAYEEINLKAPDEKLLKSLQLAIRKLLLQEDNE